MNRRAQTVCSIACCVSLSACFENAEVDVTRLGAIGQAVGEPANGFPNWFERMLHVLVNRARCDPDVALAGCSPCADVDLGCYSARPPLEWEEALNHAARFHATNLTAAGCGLRHDSPCLLVSSIATDYPESCDGSVSCACSGGFADCGGTVSNLWDRLQLFGVSTSYRAENAARFGDPFAIVDAWLLESKTTSTCDFDCPTAGDCNGHRYNILSDQYRRLGVGGDGDYAVLDFWGNGTLNQKIPSGCHFPRDGGDSTELRAIWYDPAGPPQAALVNIGGQCHEMSVERGSAGNATYLYTSAISGCVWYTFAFSDSSGQAVYYPESGAFGIGCGQDWGDDSVRPPEGSGCLGEVCGDGLVQGSETCDPPASCPSCDDDDACTVDSWSGDPSSCDVVCEPPQAISACSDSDGCCPSECNATSDSDCSPVCGNGVLEPGETCDPCPDSCDDANTCTTDSMDGSPADCDAACRHVTITACDGGDGCCPSGCNATSDSDCSPVCGNGVLEPGETCDPCPSSCDDANTCTVDETTGSANTCDVACEHEPVAGCATGDGCCPDGCDATDDADCDAARTTAAGQGCDCRSADGPLPSALFLFAVLAVRGASRRRSRTVVC